MTLFRTSYIQHCPELSSVFESFLCTAYLEDFPDPLSKVDFLAEVLEATLHGSQTGQTVLFTLRFPPQSQVGYIALNGKASVRTVVVT